MAPPAAAPGPMMAPPMMAPPPMPPMGGEQDVMSAAQQGAMEGEQLGAQLGAEYMANMDSAIDSAETPLEMINAIRGNERPLEARYSELAEYVGEEDAKDTPETVLALVQPFMMMTEQGAVDSGIGELMQKVVGDQEMPDEGPMTEGVGGLMTAGAGNTPPRNFRDGGAVRRFNVGGDVTLDSNTGPGRTAEYFPQYQQLYSQILGSDASRQEQLQESKDMAQAQMLFDIAQAGLQFAGETEGNTVAERLANAARKSEVLPRISQSAASILKAKQDYQAEKRAMDLAALGAANAEASRALGEESALARALASKKPAAANVRTFVNRQDLTDMVNVDLSTPEGLAQARALGRDYVMVDTPSISDLRGDSKDKAANFTLFVNRNDPNDTRLINIGTPEGLAEAEALGQEYLPTTTPSLDDIAGGAESPLGSSFNARLLAMVSDADTMLAYANGTLDQTDPSKAALITNTLTLATQSRPVWDQTLGREVLMPATRLSDQVLAMIQQRGERGLPVPTLGSDVGGPQVGSSVSNNPTEETQGRVRFNEDGTIDFSSFENDPTFIITGVDLTQSQDWTSGVNRFFNQIAGQLQPVLGGSGYSGERGRITSEADTQLDRLANQVMRVIRSGTDGRIFALDASLLENEVSKFRPGSFRTDNGARDALVTTRNALASSWNDAQLVLMNPSEYDRATLTAARTLQAQVERLLAETTAAVSVYDRFISSSPLGDAAADRAATSPRTSGLPRASGGN